MSRLLAECVQHGLRTLAFCKSRKTCELVVAYTREVLKDCGAEDLASCVKVGQGAAAVLMFRFGFRWLGGGG